MTIKKRQHRRGGSRKFAWGYKLASIILFLAAIFMLVSQFKHSHYFGIKKVRVYGVRNIQPEQIKALLMPYMSQNFFSINIDSIKEQLLQFPWSSRITVRKRWPDQLDITIREKKVMAIWNHHALLSDTGELFLTGQQDIFSTLPQLKGPEGTQLVVSDYFNKINRLFLSLHAKITYLEFTSIATWKLKLDNGMTLQIEHKDILNRLKHFVKIYPKILAKHEKDVDYIDLRYPNGVAVRWKRSVQT